MPARPLLYLLLPLAAAGLIAERVVGAQAMSGRTAPAAGAARPVETPPPPPVLHLEASLGVTGGTCTLSLRLRQEVGRVDLSGTLAVDQHGATEARPFSFVGAEAGRDAEIRTHIPSSCDWRRADVRLVSIDSCRVNGKPRRDCGDLVTGHYRRMGAYAAPLRR